MLTYEQFRKKHPAIRCYNEFDSDQRATLSRARTGYQARRASGSFFYIHPLQPGIAFDTAKAATTAAYAVYQSNPTLCEVKQ